MNLDPFSKTKDPLSAGSLNPAANKDIFTDNPKQGGGLGRVRKKEEADSPDAGPPPEAMAEPEKEKSAVLLRNPKWEADKVGFNEETPISVEAEIPAEHGNKKRIAFELFAKTPKGPERISQGEGMVENGKAIPGMPPICRTCARASRIGGRSIRTASWPCSAMRTRWERMNTTRRCPSAGPGRPMHS
jgi:hypothetical protein